MPRYTNQFYIYMKEIRVKVDKSNYYNGFRENISFFIKRRTSSDKTFLVFFYILALKEIDKLMENVKTYEVGTGFKDKG